MENAKRLRIEVEVPSINEFLFFVVLWFIITPTFLEHYSWLYTLNYYIKIVILIAEVLRLILSLGKGIKYNIYFIFVSLFSLSIIFSCLINSGMGITIGISNAVTYMASALYVYVKIRKDYNHYGRALYWFGFIMISINLISLLAFPDGLYTMSLHNSLMQQPYYWLGIDNGFGAFVLPILTFSMFYSRTEGKYKAFTLVEFLICLWTYFQTLSAAGLISLLVMILMLILTTWEKTSKIINGKIGIIVYIVLTVIIVFNQNLGNFDNIINFIAGLMGKSTNYSGRNVIWYTAVTQISKRLIWGYGQVSQGGYLHLGDSYYGAHNTFLQILLGEGLVGLIFFVTSIFCVFVQLYRTTKGISIEKYYHGVIAGLFSILLYFMFEAANILTFIVILTVFAGYVSNKGDLDVRY